MNPISNSADPTAPPPPQPPRSSFSCDRHPIERFTGFCPTCLCERLTTLDNSSSNTPSSSRRHSSASAAIKSLFFSKPPKPNSSFLPELRRSKSFSASKNEANFNLGLSFEPQRKSCDVKNTLCSLDEDSSKKVESSGGEEEDYRDAENLEDFVDFVDEIGDETEIRPVLKSQLVVENLVEAEVNSGGIVEEESMSVSGNLKPMKDHIDDLDTRGDEKKRLGGGGFWSAASVLTKKWQNWKRKQKNKKQSNGEKLTTLPVEKPISMQYRETQSEIADYGFGRRSCDTEPRFSLDVGRMSFDGPRYSFDEPRASWDGYLIGRNFPKMAPPMVSVMEDAPASAARKSRSDMEIPVEEPTINGVNEDENVPGGSVQTREYYLDSSCRRRKSLDRSSSIRKTAAAVVAEMDELKMVPNAKVSPTTTADYSNGAKVLVRERSLRDSNSNSLRDDCSETFELGSGYRDTNSSVIGNGDRKELKKSRRWSWKLWGLINRRNVGNKDADEEERYSRVNGVERSLSGSWQDLRREGNGDMRSGFNRNMFRSNSSVSWRDANQFGGPFESARKSGVEMNGHGKKRRDGFVLEKNRSARYSPNRVDNGLLRFYLAPMRGSRREGMGKIKPNNSNSIARSVLRLY